MPRSPNYYFCEAYLVLRSSAPPGYRLIYRKPCQKMIKIKVFVLVLLAVGSMASGGNHVAHLTESDFSERVSDGKVRPSSNKLPEEFKLWANKNGTVRCCCAGLFYQIFRTMVWSLQETGPYLGRVGFIGV